MRLERFHKTTVSRFEQLPNVEIKYGEVGKKSDKFSWLKANSSGNRSGALSLVLEQQ